MHAFRPSRVGEASAIGVVLVMAAVVAGGWVAKDPMWAAVFTVEKTTLVWLMAGYGFVASVLPVWVLLCPRDYLSTFLKIGTVLGLAVGILVSLPVIHMPAMTRFADGTGPVFSGKLFPLELPPGARSLADARHMLFNDRLDAVVALAFMAVAVLVIVVSVREWLLVLRHRKPAVLREAPYVASALVAGD
jgi:carbon starvation protein CstA